MPSGNSLISVLVVPCDACHQLLPVRMIGNSELRDELGGVGTPQRTSELAMMKHLDAAILSDSGGEAELRGAHFLATLRMRYLPRPVGWSTKRAASEL